MSRGFHADRFQIPSRASFALDSRSIIPKDLDERDPSFHDPDTTGNTSDTKAKWCVITRITVIPFLEEWHESLYPSPSLSLFLFLSRITPNGVMLRFSWIHWSTWRIVQDFKELRIPGEECWRRNNALFNNLFNLSHNSGKNWYVYSFYINFLFVFNCYIFYLFMCSIFFSAVRYWRRRDILNETYVRV